MHPLFSVFSGTIKACVTYKNALYVGLESGSIYKIKTRRECLFVVPGIRQMVACKYLIVLGYYKMVLFLDDRVYQVIDGLYFSVHYLDGYLYVAEKKVIIVMKEDELLCQMSNLDLKVADSASVDACTYGDLGRLNVRDRFEFADYNNTIKRDKKNCVNCDVLKENDDGNNTNHILPNKECFECKYNKEINDSDDSKSETSIEFENEERTQNDLHGKKDALYYEFKKVCENLNEKEKRNKEINKYDKFFIPQFNKDKMFSYTIPQECFDYFEIENKTGSPRIFNPVSTRCPYGHEVFNFDKGEYEMIKKTPNYFIVIKMFYTKLDIISILVSNHYLIALCIGGRIYITDLQSYKTKLIKLGYEIDAFINLGGFYLISGNKGRFYLISNNKYKKIDYKHETNITNLYYCNGLLFTDLQYTYHLKIDGTKLIVAWRRMKSNTWFYFKGRVYGADFEYLTERKYVTENFLESVAGKGFKISNTKSMA
ncbi:hypothetical protein COBT_001027 [Conglomerata obtusa]